MQFKGFEIHSKDIYFNCTASTYGLIGNKSCTYFAGLKCRPLF